MILLVSSVSNGYRKIYTPSDLGTEYMKQDKDLKQYYRQLNRDTVGEMIIDNDTGDLIGSVFVWTTPENKGFIFNVEVNPEYRGQGFGKVLLDDAVKKLGGIDLTVKKDNKVAISMYLKYGFEIVDSVNDDTEWYMKLKE